MTFHYSGSYLQTLPDAFTETSPALASAKLKRLFTDDNGECTVIFLSGCAEAVREGRRDVIAQCLSRIDTLRSKIDYLLGAGDSECDIRPSSMVEAALRAVLAAIELNGGGGAESEALWDEIHQSLEALHGSLPHFPDHGSVKTLQKKSNGGKALEALFRTVTQESGCDCRHWIGWLTGLIGFFIDDDSKGEFIGSVAMPLYNPSLGGDIYTLAVERLPYGTGAIYPHPVLANPFVIAKDTMDAMNTVNNLIREYMEKSGINDRQCDFIWYLKSETSGRVVRSLRGTSCSAGLTMALSSLLDSSLSGHSFCVTGSVSPEGQILPVRSMKAKLEAVDRLAQETDGILRFIIPGENFRQLSRMPALSASVVISPVSSVDEILALRNCA